MTKQPEIVFRNLDKIFNQSRASQIDGNSKIVFFSDLHMGDGGSTDDFLTNSELFKKVLKEYYRGEDYSLVLNGDIEELQRFSLEKVMTQWKSVYELFDEFAKDQQLIKTIGNHDLELSVTKDYPYPLDEGHRLYYGDECIFIYHGHQASKKYQQQNELVGFTLKYFANPLGIKNYSVSHSSKKQYKIERRVYEYSSEHKIVSVIGHTHRPLFESLHKVDRLKSRIDELCRQYAVIDHKKLYAKELRSTIESHRDELLKYYNENEENNFQSFIYHEVFPIPCLFNSGTVIGKRGITCLEISEGNIRLVHWFDKNISKKYLQQTGYAPEQLGDSDIYRMVVNEETLDYIFTRIKLLS